MSYRLALVQVLAIAIAIGLAPRAASADDGAGHVSVMAGVLGGDDDGSLAIRPHVRAELALDVIGPLAVGGFVQATADVEGLPPAFGGGVMITLRPELPLLGFVPHLELTGARLALHDRS